MRLGWPWIAVGLVVLAAVIGGALGASLGVRQAPLSESGAAGGRPTIVVATAAPSASVARSPVASVVAPTAVVAQPAQPTTEYIVQPGDTLRSIAQQQYGDATLWPRIYDANRDVIGADPDTLKPGTTLSLP